MSPVWSWVSKLINKLYDTPILLTSPIILLQQGLPQAKQFSLSNELSSFLIKITLNELWAARNLDTFESKRPTVRTIIAKIKARIRHGVNAAFNISPDPEFFQVLGPSGHSVFLCEPDVSYSRLISHYFSSISLCRVSFIGVLHSVIYPFNSLRLISIFYYFSVLGLLYWCTAQCLFSYS